MANEMKFKRYEVKFKISRAQYEQILKELPTYMIPDEHGKSTIFSLYYDTPDFRLIRRSMEHPEYKEKLRLRSYGVVTPDQPVFLELKKKYKKVVYKRRIEMTEEEVYRFGREASEPDITAWDHIHHSHLDGDTTSGKELSFSDRQIRKEIQYAFSYYPNLEPRMLLSYEREAWYAKEDHGFRITFDQNLLWRETALDLHPGVFGPHIIPEDELIMEVKTGMGIPLWLTEILTREKVYKTSFSKYATAYTQKMNAELEEKAFEKAAAVILEGQTKSEKVGFAHSRKTGRTHHRGLIGGRKYA